MNVLGLPRDQFLWFPLVITVVVMVVLAIVLKKKNLF